MNLILSRFLSFTEEQIESIRALGYSIELSAENPAELDPKLYDWAEVVVCRAMLNNDNIDLFTKLKFLQCLATGVDSVPIVKAHERGIPVCKAGDLYSIPIAEWCVMKILSVYKHSRWYEHEQAERAWRRFVSETPMRELYGKRIAIAGTGDIGNATAMRLRAFEPAEIVGLNTDGRDVSGYDKCYRTEEMADFLEGSDIIVITLPVTATTRQIINTEALSIIKDDAILVNVSRGSIVDEQAVIEKLQSTPTFSFAADVFAKEPLPTDSPLWELENAFIAPHNSFVTDKRPKRLFDCIFKNLEAYMTGAPLEWVVTNKGY